MKNYPSSIIQFKEFVELKDYRGPTKEKYVSSVWKLAQHFGCDPARLSENQLRQYFLRQLGVVWVIFGVFWAWQRIKASRGAAASHSSRPPAAKGSFDLRLPASGFTGSKFRQHAG
jgi:hypothetical protein